MFNLELCFYFLLHYLYQYKDSVAPPISRIGIIHAINTAVRIVVSLHKYDFVQMGYIGTHPLEIYFGSLRIACHCDHSYSNILRAIGKSLHVLKLLEQINQNEVIRTRLGIGGRHAKVEFIGGIIPDFTPFQLFKMVWSRMKNNEIDISFFNSWFPLYKTSEFYERISSASVLKGSNIIT